MRTMRFARVLVCAVTMLCGACVVPELAAQQADMILHNGKILTVDANFSTAEAVAITANKISGVGANESVLQQAGPNTLKIDLKGRTVIPGLIDTHLHIYGAGPYAGELDRAKIRSYPVDWKAVRSGQDVLNQIKLQIEKYKPAPGAWIYIDNQIDFRREGTTYEQARIMYEELDRWQYDKVTPNNPMIAYDGLSTWNLFVVNSKGWDILMANHGDVIKKYGRYWLDKGGRPNGHLEPPASRLVFNYIPEIPAADLAPLQKKRLEELSSMGVTTISTKIDPRPLEAYKQLEARGEMITRIGYGEGWHFGTIQDFDADMRTLAAKIGKGSDTLWTTSVAPTAVDGASTRACTNQKRMVPFGIIDSWWPVGQCHTDSEFRGAAGKAAPIEGSYFRDWLLASGRYGVRLANTHTAGDRSVANILGIMEQLQKENGSEATKGWAMDHCVLINPADFQKAARLGATFSCAPKYIQDVAPEAAKSYGEEVANKFVVPVKSMIDAGVKVVYEADRDIYAWEDIELLMTRKDKTGKVWGPQERVDKATALKMITRWAGEYVLKPEKLGSIETGKLADLVVLDRDYMAVPVEEVSDIQPQLTVFDGKVVFLHPKFSEEYSLKPSGAVISTYKDLIGRRKPGTFNFEFGG